MTPEQADLIRRSFDAMWPVHRKFAATFYRHFFELAPDARRLFPDDMERQHVKLMDMIAAIVGALEHASCFSRSSGKPAISMRASGLRSRTSWHSVSLDLEPGGAVRRRIHAGAAPSMDCALRRGPRRYD